MQTVLTLPYPPSINHLWMPIAKWNARAHRHYGELVLSPEAKRYYTDAGWEVLAQRPRAHCWPYAWPVVVTLVLTPPDQRVRDLDNPVKAVLDLLVKTQVLADDRLVGELHLYWREAEAPGQLRITIDLLSPAPDTMPPSVAARP